MRNSFSLLPLFFCLGFAACARDPAGQPAARPAAEHVAWGPADRGLRTRIVPLQFGFTLGEPMRFRIEMKNEGETTVVFRDYSKSWECLEVTGPDGKKAPHIGDLIAQVYILEQKIGPGETVVLHDDVDAWRLYFMERPGKYAVRFPGTSIVVDRSSLPEGGKLEKPAPKPPKGFDPWIGENELGVSVPSNILRIDAKEGGPLPPAYVIAGRIHAVAPRGWTVMLPEVGGGGSPGEVSIFARGNWIHIRVSKEGLGESKPGWESWGQSPFGNVHVSLPIRAEGRWPEARAALQDILQASNPAIEREGEEALLITLYSVIRNKDASRLVELVMKNPGLARRRFELDSGLKAGREETLLHVATRFGEPALCTLLLDLGADIDALSRSGRTALQFAVSGDDIDMARLLIDRGADVDLTGKYKRSPLGVAAVKKNEALARLLIDRGADVNGRSRGNLSCTALGDAIMGGSPAVVRLLLDSGADPNFVQNDHWHPLTHASREGNGEIVRLLIERGAKLHHRTEKTQQTALHMACYKGTLEIVKLLLEKGAELNPTDWRGKTPLDFAEERGDAEIIELLKARGAVPGGR